MERNRALKKVFTSSLSIRFSLTALSVLALFFISPVKIMAQGGLLITPRRIVFEGKQNIKQLNLANTGRDTASFDISFVQYRMTENGGFEQITKPDSGQRFADGYLRLFPRRVTLAPGEAQLIKIQLKNYRSLSSGEYRSHLYFRTVNNTKPLGEGGMVKDTTSIAIRLVPIFGISIPVIIRKGKSTTHVSLSGLSIKMLNDSTPSLNITFNRSGNMSVYGDIEVDFISPLKTTTQVGLVRGIAVYTPNTIRHFNLKLDNKFDYNTGKLRVIYKTNSDMKPTIIAEKELILHK